MSGYTPHRRVALSRIVDAKWIAKVAGVTPAAVGNWRTRYADFPRPLPVPGVSNPIYDRSDVEEWLSRHPQRIRREEHEA